MMANCTIFFNFSIYLKGLLNMGKEGIIKRSLKSFEQNNENQPYTYSTNMTHAVQMTH